jgi:hypothetical protein
MLALAVISVITTTALAAAPTQVQLHPSQPNKGELSVDFVGSTPAPGSCKFGARAKESSVTTTQFNFPNIGTLHQAVLDFGARFGLQAGDVAWYACSCDGGKTFSANTSVTPITAAPPRAAIFGDFGLTQDIIMSALAADSGNEVRSILPPALISFTAPHLVFPLPACPPATPPPQVFDYVLHVGDFAVSWPWSFAPMHGVTHYN